MRERSRDNPYAPFLYMLAGAILALGVCWSLGWLRINSEPGFDPMTSASVIAGPTYSVIRVIDGDTLTIWYRDEETSVRLFGIDTPERGEPGFHEATGALRRIVEGEKIRIEFANVNDKRDKYGRLLARVVVNGRDVGNQLLQAGLAQPYRE
jgi:endonuclease YncB( thermonuclease family)